MARQRRDAFYDSAGRAVSRDPSGRSATHVGQEFDAEAKYQVAENLGLGAGIGHIGPGAFLKRTNHGLGYTYTYTDLFMEYNFL